ncbi:MAG TPA: hypothetical protein DDY14_17940 [Chromatiaceae bacterium]|jgi:hypothetical protein|nr:MAG: hypothetical protein N838_16655 [Thiohalocapsa sp. PB-PSB1]QQO56367.1 MAG: hypothetical protein N838_26395 [Thiohalocapsa sp. PB-PSB1]HBG97159.1 hypothetical protein [Chromatiaceae bacterium]HCS88607.1 hypothetical protein [Chromatiaceae bacterium]
MLRVPGVVLAALLILCLLAGCSSTTAISGDEEAYRGQFVAAVTPVRLSGDATIGVRERRRIQLQIVRGLDAAGIFASVMLLSSASENNESEIIIEPSIIESRSDSNGLQRIMLRVRALRKSTGEIGLDDRYKGRTSSRGDAASAIVKDLARDLDRRYGQPPIY